MPAILWHTTTYFAVRSKAGLDRNLKSMERPMQLYRRLIERNQHLSTAWWHLQMHLAEMRGRQSVVVYQMGKVGSSSIVASLRALPQKLQIHHVHTLTKQGIAHAEAIYRQMSLATQSNTATRARHLQSSRYLTRSMNSPRSHSRGKRWKVVTLVREPIARNVSSFFQTIDHLLPHFMARYDVGEIDIETVNKTFLENFDHQQVLQWFDVEIAAALGIDVYSSAFPKERGYQLYRGETCDLLLLKLEMLNSCAADAFYDFLGVDNFELIKSNVADEKEYAQAYLDFKRSVQLPDPYLHQMYASRYMQHFYCPNEIATFASKWKNHYDA